MLSTSFIYTWLITIQQLISRFEIAQQGYQSARAHLGGPPLDRDFWSLQSECMQSYRPWDEGIAAIRACGEFGIDLMLGIIPPPAVSHSPYQQQVRASPCCQQPPRMHSPHRR